jgi:uncharacterized protein
LDDVSDNVIRLSDVAHALSRLPRWNGHAEPEVTVADHCLRCCHVGREAGLPLILQWHLLMHDMPEFITGDCPSWIKRTFVREGYRRIEAMIVTLAYDQWQLPRPSIEDEAHVKGVDQLALQWERMHFMRNHHHHLARGRDAVRLEFTLTARRLYAALRPGPRDLQASRLQPEAR